MQAETMGCIVVALFLLVGCQEPPPAENAAPSNLVEHESDAAIERYLQSQDENSRQMAEQFQEQAKTDPDAASTPADAGPPEPLPAAPEVTVDII